MAVFNRCAIDFDIKVLLDDRSWTLLWPDLFCFSGETIFVFDDLKWHWDTPTMSQHETKRQKSFFGHSWRFLSRLFFFVKLKKWNLWLFVVFCLLLNWRLNFCKIWTQIGRVDGKNASPKNLTQGIHSQGVLLLEQICLRMNELRSHQF